MTPKLPKDANGCPIQAMKPTAGVNKLTTETFLNDTTAKGGDNDTGSEIIRVVATDADAKLVISANGASSGDGTFLSQSIPEYLHIPIGWSVYVEGATVNFSPCL